METIIFYGFKGNGMVMFKSHYVVWKQKYWNKKKYAVKVFKSHYVVWKHKKETCLFVVS